MPRTSSAPLVLGIIVLAVGTLACGSPAPTTAPQSPIPTVAIVPTGTALPDLTPASSPTPVPASSVGSEEGVFRTQHVIPNAGVPLPIVLKDLTGLVTGIVPAETWLPPFREGISNPAGQPGTLSYVWVGGSCDTLASITFERAAGGFRLTSTTTRRAGSCDLMGVSRGIEIALSEPVDAGSVLIASS